MNMINVQLSVDSEITQIDERELVKRTGEIDNDVEYTTWIEYRLASDPNGRVVHRSVNMILKMPAVSADGAVASV